MLSQRSGSAGWSLVYGIAKADNVGLVLVLEPLPWDTDMFEVAGWFAADILSPAVWIGGWGEEVMLIVLEAIFVFEVLAFYISIACSAYDRSLEG